MSLLSLFVNKSANVAIPVASKMVAAVIVVEASGPRLIADMTVEYCPSDLVLKN